VQPIFDTKRQKPVDSLATPFKIKVYDLNLLDLCGHLFRRFIASHTCASSDFAIAWALKAAPHALNDTPAFLNVSRV